MFMDKHWQMQDLWYWFRMHLSRVKVVENQDLSKTLHSV